MGLAKVAGSIEMQPEPATADSCGPKEPLVDELQHTGAKWRIQWNDLCGRGDVDCRFQYCSNSFFRVFCIGHEHVPRFRLNTYGRRAFSVAGPMAWNSLTGFIWDPTSSTDCLRRMLKTYLFAQYQCIQRIRGS